MEQVNESSCSESEMMDTSSRENQIVCRIWLQPELDNIAMISPWKCTGSMKFAHEQCIKAWMESKEMDKKTAQCEVWKTAFKLIVTYGLKWKNVKPKAIIPLILFLIILLIGYTGLFTLVFIYVVGPGTAYSQFQGAIVLAFFVVVVALLIGIGILTVAAIKSWVVSYVSVLSQNFGDPIIPVPDHEYASVTFNSEQYGNRVVPAQSLELQHVDTKNLESISLMSEPNQRTSNDNEELENDDQNSSVPLHTELRMRNSRSLYN